jgi:hypothetical protein
MDAISKIFKGIRSWSIAIALLIGPTYYVARFAPLAYRIVGTWPASDSTQTTTNTFKSNGEWELVATWKSGVNSDGSGVGRPLVFKGHYSTSFNTFRTFDVKRYVRVEGKDIEWAPASDCVATNSCLIDAETMKSDKEASDPKRFQTIVAADWWEGTMTTRSASGKITTWIR